MLCGRYIEKIAQHRPLVSDPLEVVKFVCKDFWEEVFKKKVWVVINEGDFIALTILV